MKETVEAPDDKTLLLALERLRDIGARINRLGHDDPDVLDATLRLIVEGAAALLPDACAVLYTYDPLRGAIDPVSRVAAGPNVAALTGDHPRENGLGMTALRERRRVLSYEQPTLTVHPAKQAAGARTVACLPLLIAEEPVGVLYVYLTEARALEPWELLLLDNFVNQAALALYHAGQFSRVRRHLARKEDELALLHRAGLLISSRSRLEDTLEAILEMALEVTGARYGIFRLVDRTRQQLVMRAIAGDRLGRPATEALPIDGTSIMGWVAMTRQPLNIPDVQQPPWSDIYYPLDRALQMRSDLAVPLIGAGGRLEGVLNLESPEVAAFSEADCHLLQALANHAVIAIQEVRLLDGLRKTTERLLTQDTQTVLAHLVELACDLVNASAGALWTADRDGLIPAASSAYYRPDSDRELVQRALETGSLLIYNWRRDAAAGGTTDLPSCTLVAPVPGVKGQGPAAAFVIHLQAGQALDQSPTYETGSRDVGSSEWDKKVLSILAHYAGLALTAATQRRALAQAQEARAVAETFAVLGDVAANVLHHLNNKVGTIPVRIEGIQDKYAEVIAANPYLATNLAEIERAALEALSAVRERLSLLQPIEAGPVSVADCVADVLARVRLPVDVIVTTEGLDMLPAVLASRETLALVLVNLLENAAEAMNGRGHVKITGRAESGWVELTVRDDGPGIPRRCRRIFEFNFSWTRGRTPPGEPAGRSKLGFGLWWVKTAMARLGGTVTVESNGQDGAAFLLRLPVTEV